MKKSRTAGGVVLNSEGQVLVVNQNYDSWSLPKGHIDAGEEPLEAARREIYEESGIRELEFVKALGSYQRPRISQRGGDDPRELKEIHLFLFRTREHALKPLDPKNPEARWVDKNAVADLLTHSKDKEFFLDILEDLQ